MPIDGASAVADLAASLPGALRVFDDLHIDYCCAGARSLVDACRVEGLDVRDVVARIEKAADEGSPDDAPWLTRSLAALIGYVVVHYHAPTRVELASLRSLVAGLQEEEAESHPELRRVASLLVELEGEMIPHMVKEERILFPYVIELEARARAGNRRPRVELGTGQNPLRAMMEEHHHADATLRALRSACGGYVAPAGTPAAIGTLYERLERLERRLHHHVHLESNVLFRRAMELERA
jgi:regulator of cell morphogenesis and NO signaling